MIYDIFPFGYEIDILLLRLATLADVVDRFVIVEGTRTFTGKPRVPMLETVIELDPRFEPYRERVGILVIEIPEDVEPAAYVPGQAATKEWTRERMLRGSMLPAADAAGCGPDDLVIISDVDEIPHPEQIRRCCRNVLSDFPTPPWRLVGRYYQLKMNLRAQGSPGWLWEHRQPLMGRRSAFTHAESDRAAQDAVLSTAEPYGWHFSCMGTPVEVAQKLASYSHTELAHITAADVRNRIDQRRDIANRCDLDVVPLSELPEPFTEMLYADPHTWAKYVATDGIVI